MMAGSSFRFSAANGDSSDEWTLWGRGATTSFSGEGDTLSHDGSVTTGTVGVDYTWGDVIGGVALSHSAGDGEFEVGSAVAGELDSSMTLLSPYVRFKMSCCVTFWGVAGVGAGDMTLAADGGGAGHRHRHQYVDGCSRVPRWDPPGRWDVRPRIEVGCLRGTHVG